jgi:hypothetical protein
MIQLALLPTFLLFTWTTLAVPSPRESVAGQFFIQREGERLTVDAREVPHQRLIEAMAQRLDFELILKGSLPQPRSVSVEGRPWEEALKQVLSPASWAFKYTRTAAGDRLVQVTVFPSEPRPAPERRENHATGTGNGRLLAHVSPPEGTGVALDLEAGPPEQEATEAVGQDTQEAQPSPQHDAEGTLQR